MDRFITHFVLKEEFKNTPLWVVDRYGLSGDPEFDSPVLLSTGLSFIGRYRFIGTVAFCDETIFRNTFFVELVIDRNCSFLRQCFVIGGLS